MLNLQISSILISKTEGYTHKITTSKFLTKNIGENNFNTNIIILNLDKMV